jgi:hypothetical protein
MRYCCIIFPGTEELEIVPVRPHRPSCARHSSSCCCRIELNILCSRFGGTRACSHTGTRDCRCQELVRWHLRRNRSRHSTLLTTPTRQNPSFLISALNLVFLVAIESPDRVLSIPANGVFQNVVVVEPNPQEDTLGGWLLNFKCSCPGSRDHPPLLI